MHNTGVTAPTPPTLAEQALTELFGEVGDQAILPAGSHLIDVGRPARQCFVILEGRATAESAGGPSRTWDRGSFVGDASAAGLPVPLSGQTVHLETAARVLVIDPGRLADLIATRPELAALWRAVVSALWAGGRQADHDGPRSA